MPLHTTSCSHGSCASRDSDGSSSPRPYQQPPSRQVVLGVAREQLVLSAHTAGWCAAGGPTKIKDEGAKQQFRQVARNCDSGLTMAAKVTVESPIEGFPGGLPRHSNNGVAVCYAAPGGCAACLRQARNDKRGPCGLQAMSQCVSDDTADLQASGAPCASTRLFSRRLQDGPSIPFAHALCRARSGPPRSQPSHALPIRRYCVPDRIPNNRPVVLGDSTELSMENTANPHQAICGCCNTQGIVIPAFLSLSLSPTTRPVLLLADPPTTDTPPLLWTTHARLT